MKKLRAIDLYSGVGGWSLGLRLAGIEVVGSYDVWGPANETNFKNNRHQAQTVDIRRLALKDLPENIDIVVGSPPCTQFSYSNRGGSGNIDDGLEDIRCFLKIVDHLRPKVWAMENVPRVAKIISSELQQGGALEEYAHLDCHPHIVNMAEYGLPQRRRRNISGNFDMARLETYKARMETLLLGGVIESLRQEPVIDPLYGVSIPQKKLTDHVVEGALNAEEARINRANKTTHTIYNAMVFPDPLDRTVRTITATCTRVSRESIVVPVSKGAETYRRLTIRERSCLQGFPVTFQFYGSSYSQKLRMVGNAVPPAFSFLIAHAMLGTPATKLPTLSSVGSTLTQPEPLPASTPTDRAGSKYPTDRNFKYAVPSLQLKSGVRFELRNRRGERPVGWEIAFFFGTSKRIETIALTRQLAERITRRMSAGMRKAASTPLSNIEALVGKADLVNMQAVWAHRRPGGTRPFMLLDWIDDAGTELTAALENYVEEAKRLVRYVVESEFVGCDKPPPGISKLERNAGRILSGLLISSRLNPILDERIGMAQEDSARQEAEG